VPEHQQPVLVYNRIAANRRNTAALLAAVPLILLPFGGGIVVYFVPWFLFAGGLPESLLRENPLGYELLATTIAAAIVLAIMTVAMLVTTLLYRFAMLRAIGATPLTRDQEPDLWRSLENLCIGAGLPQPRLYLVESNAPNAFATGPDPAHASLGITRGLLTLLERRELEGVIAHELSHIGNQDTRLSTAVAAALVTLRFPIGLVMGIYRTLAAIQRGFGIVFLLGFLGFFGMMSAMSIISIGMLSSYDIPRWMLWRQVFIGVSPCYVLIGAPAIGLFIRQALSRQREFLADADAVVLTRDPEGLGLALAKIAAWAGPRTLNVGPTAAHFCIADPLPRDAPWWDKLLPCHPPIQARIDLLSRMGSGISVSALNAAADTGATAGLRAYASQTAPLSPSDDNRERAISAPAPASAAISLYEKPDGWSNVLGELPEGSPVTVCGTEGNFFKVLTANQVVGYIGRSTLGHLTTNAHKPEALHG